MNKDKLTPNIEKADEDDKETQPTITAVFRLLQDVDSRLTARLDELNTRVTELNTRVTEGFRELTHKTNALNKRALQQEADTEELFERIEHVESKVS